jgi:hypothetical protein
MWGFRSVGNKRQRCPIKARPTWATAFDRIDDTRAEKIDRCIELSAPLVFGCRCGDGSCPGNWPYAA